MLCMCMCVCVCVKTEGVGEHMGSWFVLGSRVSLYLKAGVNNQDTNGLKEMKVEIYRILEMPSLGCPQRLI